MSLEDGVVGRVKRIGCWDARGRAKHDARTESNAVIGGAASTRMNLLRPITTSLLAIAEFLCTNALPPDQAYGLELTPRAATFVN